MGNACSHEAGAEDIHEAKGSDGSNHQEISGGRRVTIASSSGATLHNNSTMQMTSPENSTPSGEAHNNHATENGHLVSPVVTPVGPQQTPSPLTAPLKVPPFAPPRAENLAAASGSTKVLSSRQHRGSLRGSSLGGVNYMLETGGASRSGFGAASSSNPRDRSQPKRRRKVLAATTVSNAMASNFAKHSDEQTPPLATSVKEPTNLPLSPLTSNSPQSGESSEMVEDAVSVPLSGGGGATADGFLGVAKSPTSLINKQLPPVDVTSDSNQSSESDLSKASGGASGRKRLTSFVADTQVINNTPSATAGSQASQSEDDLVISATIGGVLPTLNSSPSSHGSGSPIVNSARLQNSRPSMPLKLPAVSNSFFSHRDSVAESTASSVASPALLLRTLPEGIGGGADGGISSMLSTLRSPHNESSAPTAIVPKHVVSVPVSQRTSLVGSFHQSLSALPSRRVGLPSICSICEEERPQFICADCVETPFVLCEECFHCMEESAHNSTHHFQVIDGTKFASDGIRSDYDEAADSSDYSSSSDNDEDEDFVGAASPETPSALFDPCCSCSTFSYENVVYRCRECAGYILCERCFLKGKYKHPASHRIQPIFHAKTRRRKSGGDNGGGRRVVAATKKDTTKGTHDDSGNRIINNYVVIKEIGRGSYARVRLLQHMETKELFAVKVLRRELLAPRSHTTSPRHSNAPMIAGSQSTSSNSAPPFAPLPHHPFSGSHHSTLFSGSISTPFSESDPARQLVVPTVMDSLREIAVLKLIDHPNVVKLVEVIDDEEGGKVYLIMEYLEGGCIHDLGNPPLPPAELFNYTSDLLASILHLHSLMLYHQDVKPANCLLSRDGVAKIADFGTCDSRHKVNGVKGTPAFLSPELVMGVDTTGAMVDAWAFGVTLYQVASGELPFPITSMYAFNQSITSPQPVTIPDNVEDSDLRDLLSLLLEKDIKKRYNLLQAAEHPYYRRGCEPKRGRARVQANMAFTPRYAGSNHDLEPPSTNGLTNNDSFGNCSRTELLERAGSLILKGSNVGKSFHGQYHLEKHLNRRAVREQRKNSDSVRSAADSRRRSSGERRKTSVTLLTPDEGKQINFVSPAQPNPQGAVPNATTLVNTYLEHVDTLPHKSLNLSYAIVYRESFLQSLAQTSPTLQALHFHQNISFPPSITKAINWTSFVNLTRLKISSCELSVFPAEILFGSAFEWPVSHPSTQSGSTTPSGLSPNSPAAANDQDAFPSKGLSGGCPRLEKLDLSYNFIEEIPEAIGEYESLESLNLEGNCLAAFPAGKTFRSVNLKKVNLSGNVIKALPASGLAEATHNLQIAVDDHPVLKEEWARSVVSNPSLRSITFLWTGVYPKLPFPVLVPQLLIGTCEQTLYFGSVKSELSICHFVVPAAMLEDFERCNKFSDRIVGSDTGLSLSSMSVSAATKSSAFSPEARSLHVVDASNGTVAPNAKDSRNISTSTATVSSPASSMPHYSTTSTTLSVMGVPPALHTLNDSHALFVAGSATDYGAVTVSSAPTSSAGAFTSMNTTVNPSFRASTSSSQQLSLSPQQVPNRAAAASSVKRNLSVSIPSDSSTFVSSRHTHFVVTPVLLKRRSVKRLVEADQPREGGETTGQRLNVQNNDSQSTLADSKNVPLKSIAKSQTAAFEPDSQNSGATVLEILAASSRLPPSATTPPPQSPGLIEGVAVMPTATMFIESPRESPSTRSLVVPEGHVEATSLDNSIDSMNSPGAVPRTVVRVLENSANQSKNTAVSNNPHYQHIYHHNQSLSDPSAGIGGAAREDPQANSYNSITTNTTAGPGSGEPALLKYLVEHVVNRKEPVLLLLDPSKVTLAEYALITHCTRLLLVEHFGLSSDEALEALRSVGATAHNQTLWSPETPLAHQTPMNPPN